MSITNVNRVPHSNFNKCQKTKLSTVEGFSYAEKCKRRISLCSSKKANWFRKISYEQKERPKKKRWRQSLWHCMKNLTINGATRTESKITTWGDIKDKKNSGFHKCPCAASKCATVLAVPKMKSLNTIWIDCFQHSAASHWQKSQKNNKRNHLDDKDSESELNNRHTTNFNGNFSKPKSFMKKIWTSFAAFVKQQRNLQCDFMPKCNPTQIANQFTFKKHGNTICNHSASQRNERNADDHDKIKNPSIMQKLHLMTPMQPSETQTNQKCENFCCFNEQALMWSFQLEKDMARAERLSSKCESLTMRLAFFVFPVIDLSFFFVFDNCELFHPFRCFECFVNWIQKKSTISCKIFHEFSLFYIFRNSKWIVTFTFWASVGNGARVFGWNWGWVRSLLLR